MNNMQITNYIETNQLNNILIELYGCEDLDHQKKRYSNLIRKFNTIFKEKSPSIFSAPGRVELGGNHTDHNNGCVLAGAISKDALAIAVPTTDKSIEIYSEGYSDAFKINLTDLNANEKEKESTEALIRGVADGLKRHNYRIGGFKAVIDSEVLKGSGLSSSAAFEILLGTIFNYFYNAGSITPTTLAIIGQYAENEHFGKPCGLMDQTASAWGGIIGIDFKNALNPEIKKVNISFKQYGYSLLIVDSGGNHADLTDDYAAIPEEMFAVAAFFKKQNCREITLNDIIKKISYLRNTVGDRAILRAFHFINENIRVSDMLTAIKMKDIHKYFKLINESGRSSFEYLQNIYSPAHPKQQGVSLVLALTDSFLKGEGAFRIQGGGFAGTIQVYVPVRKKEKYLAYIESIFGKGSVTEAVIRSRGAIKII